MKRGRLETAAAQKKKRLQKGTRKGHIGCMGEKIAIGENSARKIIEANCCQKCQDLRQRSQGKVMTYELWNSAVELWIWDIPYCQCKLSPSDNYLKVRPHPCNWHQRNGLL